MARLGEIGLIVLLAALFAPAWAQENVPAEAEVSATKNSIQLTFRLYKTKIRAKEESLWYQLEIKNVGKKGMGVPGLLHAPWNIDISRKNRPAPYGIYFQAIGRKGEIYDFHPIDRDTPLECWPKEEREALEEHSNKIAAIIEQGGGEKVSDDEIDRRVAHMHDGQPHEIPLLPNGSWLAPGASTTTAAWAHRGQCDEHNGIPSLKPIGQFAELTQLWFDLPGKYSIRAVYNYQQPRKLKKQLKAETAEFRKFSGHDPFPPRPAHEWEIVVKTPAISFEVVP